MVLIILMPLAAAAQLSEEGTDGYDADLRMDYGYDYADRYRGHVEEDGYGRFRNGDGDTLRGYIDPDGYGTLHDLDGNFYRVKPR